MHHSNGGIYALPRAVQGTSLRRAGLTAGIRAGHGREAVCCGTSGWLQCDAVSRQLQAERLREAADTGAQTLVTACPKCRIHFLCAQCGESDDDVKGLRIRDYASVVREAMEGGEAIGDTA